MKSFKMQNPQTVEKMNLCIMKEHEPHLRGTKDHCHQQQQLLKIWDTEYISGNVSEITDDLLWGLFWHSIRKSHARYRSSLAGRKSV